MRRRFKLSDALHPLPTSLLSRTGLLTFSLALPTSCLCRFLLLVLRTRSLPQSSTTVCLSKTRNHACNVSGKPHAQLTHITPTSSRPLSLIKNAAAGGSRKRCETLVLVKFDAFPWRAGLTRARWSRAARLLVTLTNGDWGSCLLLLLLLLLLTGGDRGFGLLLLCRPAHRDTERFKGGCSSNLGWYAGRTILERLRCERAAIDRCLDLSLVATRVLSTQISYSNCLCQGALTSSSSSPPLSVGSPSVSPSPSLA